ncbi:MAG: PH domain-containing protein [Elusimicrobia bacterium]|nr:PH domain-containing protein [Elusimicrobiota bacterium]
MTGAAEETLWSGSPALRTAWPALALAGASVLGAPALYVYGAGLWCLGAPVLGGVLFGAAWLKTRMHRYVVTSQRVIAVAGFLSRSRVEIELSDIRQLTLKQSLGQRLLGVGDIEIESAGGGEVEIRVAAIARPAEVLESIRRARLSTKVSTPI